MTAIGAVVLAATGFFMGGLGSAWKAQDDYAEPWRKMRVEHEGVPGKPNHTRIVFENPKLAIQAVDLDATGEGVATLARIALREGEELSMTFDEKGRAASLTAPDGAVARFAYEGDRTRVTFFGADGTEVGSKRISVPIQLLAEASSPASNDGARSVETRLAHAWESISSACIGEAWAKEGDDEPITVTRELPLALDVRLTGADASKAGTAQLEASCAPFVCVPARHEIDVPGATDTSVTITGTVKKSALSAPAEGAIDPFKAEAKAERKAATKALPKVARVVGSVAVTAMACKSLSLTSSLCVKEFRSHSGVAGGAISSLLAHTVAVDAGSVEQRAEALFYQDEARTQLDKDTKVEVCVSRDGYARVCEHVDGRPFGTEPLTKASRAVELRRGVGGTLLGSFVVTQGDGTDCKFSPSPKTAGVMRLTFDQERDTVTASLSSNERGSRPNLGCSLGTANMNWSQNYTISATQTFTKEQLGAGGKLPLRLVGTMTGSGNYSFSNCRSSDGASASCPPGKGDGYSYPVVIDGSIDLDTHVGGGQVVVSGAPLSTMGTWRVPADPAAPKGTP